MANIKLERTTPNISEENSVVKNGILRCYNMFPTQFHSITEMIKYLPALKAMGFNAVWINPLQKAGDAVAFFIHDKTHGVRAFNEVTRSLYAMTDSDTISPYFSDASPDADPETKKRLDMEALQEFTLEARKNGLVPMFDLVLNHIAMDSRHRVEHPHWFYKETHAEFKDAIAFDYRNPAIRTQIIEEFWKPYIYKYMIDYGFDGIRVDAVGYLNPELRAQIYTYVYDLAEKHGKPKPIILDELLFNDKNKKLSDVVDSLLLPEKGPTHITRTTYYAQKDQYGGLPNWDKEDEGLKAQLVFLNKKKQIHPQTKGGCIGFSGNHDHKSLALTVLEEIAQKRLQKHHALYHAQCNFKNERMDQYDEALNSVFLYSFVKDIQNEILQGNQNTINDVEKKMREKIATCALSSSGGWYALSGDEFGDLRAKSVFRRANAVDQLYYPQRTHHIFNPQHVYFQTAMDVIKEMAIENIYNETAGSVYDSLRGDTQSQNRLLVPYIETLVDQINSADARVCKEFKKNLREKSISIRFSKANYTPTPRTPENGWNGRHDLRSFILKINNLLDTLPASKLCFWSEVFLIQSNPNLMAVVRKNGHGFDSETNIVIVNLDPNTRAELTLKDIENLACNFQKRCIPEYTYLENEEGCQYNWHIGNSDFNLAYQTVRNCIWSNRIHVDDSIATNLPVHAENRFSMFYQKQSSKVHVEESSICNVPLC